MTEQEVIKGVADILWNWIESKKSIPNTVVAATIHNLYKRQAGYVQLSEQQRKILATCSGHHL